MKKNDIKGSPHPGMPNPLTFDQTVCNGCNLCIETCQVDLMLPNPRKGKVPVVMYPGECWYCGCCVAACPREGAIRLNGLLMNKVTWRDKSTFPFPKDVV